MQQPPGFEVPGREQEVCLLLKAIYGSKQASGLFYNHVKTSLLSLPSRIANAEVHQSRADDCLYFLRRGASWMSILTHVDDFLITHNDKMLYDAVFNDMRANFQITDYNGAPASKFCGVRINRRSSDGAYLLDQSLYITELLERLDMLTCRMEASPEATGTKARLQPQTLPLTPAENALMCDVPYREAVGALWWLARCTRYDIFRAVQQV